MERKSLFWKKVRYTWKMFLHPPIDEGNRFLYALWVIKTINSNPLINNRRK